MFGSKARKIEALEVAKKELNDLVECSRTNMEKLKNLIGDDEYSNFSDVLTTIGNIIDEREALAADLKKVQIELDQALAKKTKKKASKKKKR